MNQNWQVELSPKAITDLKGFDQTVRAQIAKGIDKLKTEPQGSGQKRRFARRVNLKG